MARKEAASGIYHIMLSGINRKTVFEDDEDIEKFKDPKICECYMGTVT